MRLNPAVKRRLLEAYSFPGFRPRATVCEADFDAGAVIVTLDRRRKKRSADVAARLIGRCMTAGRGWSAICRAAAFGFSWNLRYGGLTAGAAAA
jgi:hypothetical protein